MAQGVLGEGEQSVEDVKMIIKEAGKPQVVAYDEDDDDDLEMMNAQFGSGSGDHWG